MTKINYKNDRFNKLLLILPKNIIYLINQKNINIRILNKKELLICLDFKENESPPEGAMCYNFKEEQYEIVIRKSSFSNMEDSFFHEIFHVFQRECMCLNIDSFNVYDSNEIIGEGRKFTNIHYYYYLYSKNIITKEYLSLEIMAQAFSEYMRKTKLLEETPYINKIIKEISNN